LDYIKACDQQFTLTTKKSLHITFKLNTSQFGTFVSDIAVFVLKKDVKLQPTNRSATVVWFSKFFQ